MLSFENNWQPGPCIVLVMVGMFAAAWGFERLAGVRRAARRIIK